MESLCPYLQRNCRRQFLAPLPGFISMPSPNTDRNLLFGILAVQMDFISKDALVQAMHAWVLDKAKPIGRILLDQNALASDTHQLLEALVKKHLALHDNVADRSL